MLRAPDYHSGGARIGTPFDKGGGHRCGPTIATDSRYNNSTSLGRDGGHGGIVPPKSTCSTRMYDVAKL